MYAKKDDIIDIIFICLYVDNIVYTILIISFILTLLTLLWINLSLQYSEFEIRDISLLEYFLSIGICQVEDEIFISQRKYAKNIELIYCA